VADNTSLTVQGKDVITTWLLIGSRTFFINLQHFLINLSDL